MGAAGFGRIAPLLAETYTVVTFDPRGFAGSTIDDPGQDAEPDLLADDVRRVF
jgi:clorobiocin biosynthesis protein CloN7